MVATLQVVAETRDLEGSDRTVTDVAELAAYDGVTNGKGHIIREMALGSKRLDLCVVLYAREHARCVDARKHTCSHDVKGI